MNAPATAEAVAVVSLAARRAGATKSPVVSSPKWMALLPNSRMTPAENVSHAEHEELRQQRQALAGVRARRQPAAAGHVGRGEVRDPGRRPLLPHVARGHPARSRPCGPERRPDPARAARSRWHHGAELLHGGMPDRGVEP